MNLATELTKTAKGLPATVEGRKVSPMHDIEDDGFPEPPTLDECKNEMLRAYAEFKDQAGAAIRAGCALGTAAAMAKGMLPHGDFTPWVKKNFPFSEQWVRTCMRAAEAWALALAAPKKHDAALADATTIEKLAALVRPLKGLEPNVRKLTLDTPPAKELDKVVDVTPRPVADKGLDARVADLERREKALDAKAKRLDKLEEELNARRDALDERERNLALAAPAAAADTPMSVAAKVKAASKALKALKEAGDPPTPTLDAAIDASDPIADAKAAMVKHQAREKAKADKKRGIMGIKTAPSKDSAPTYEPTSAPVEGSVAGSPENGPQDDTPM